MAAQETSGKMRLPVRDQVSAGGVAFRRDSSGVEIAVISVGDPPRWQLPKGLVDPGESPEETAIREVREEAGIETELIAPLDTIEYWYVGTSRGEHVRLHKFVHFFLLAYRAGDVTGHDREVLDARWVPLEEAVDMLAFKNEQAVIERAKKELGSM